MDRQDAEHRHRLRVRREAHGPALPGAGDRDGDGAASLLPAAPVAPRGSRIEGTDPGVAIRGSGQRSGAAGGGTADVARALGNPAAIARRTSGMAAGPVQLATLFPSPSYRTEYGIGPGRSNPSISGS